jgi:hypothetical protein
MRIRSASLEGPDSRRTTGRGSIHAAAVSGAGQDLDGGVVVAADDQITDVEG